MKILVAIESSENPKKLSRSTLRWAARGGFNMRIFIPDDSQLEEYRAAINNANYMWYLDLPPTVVVSKITPEELAFQENFDLILYLPDNLHKWHPHHNHDRNVIDYAADVGKARLLFRNDDNKFNHEFGNGALMERV